MKGIVLAIDLYDYKSELKVKDLVKIDDIYYSIIKIDKRYNKSEGEEDNEYCYFVKSKQNDELMNFKRNEISKCNIGIFDSLEYFKSGKKIQLGQISLEDLNNIKSKALLEWDLPYSDINNVLFDDILELEFNGYIIQKEFTTHYDDTITLVKYFKLS
jgi:hypothetical protein